MLEVAYDEARSLAAALRGEGRTEAAEALENSLYGATSGEALALMGAALKALLKGREPLTPESRDRASRLRARVDDLLRR